MSRKNYEMTEAQLAKLLDACRSGPMIALNCGPIRSPQENANDAWRELGKEMGFKWDTAEPTGRGDRFFSAEPVVDNAHATLHQNPERGVTEAMVDVAEKAWNESAFSGGTGLRGRLREVVAALSAAEPAAQGEVACHRFLGSNGEVVTEWEDGMPDNGKRFPDLCPPVGSVQYAYTAPPAQPAERVPDGVFYIDCEFDGHNGPLLSIALVAQDGRSVHIKTDAIASDPWVIANVVPLLDEHHAQTSVTTHCNGVGEAIRAFLAGCNTPEIVADSPVDIARFCASLSTDASGHWASADYPRLTFRVENVDCYPTTLEGAVQHNAWWDAMALRHKLTASPAPSEGGKGVEG